MLDEVVHRVADRVAGCLVARDDEEQEVGVEVVLAERLAIHRRGIDQGRHEVATLAADTLSLELVAVGPDLERGRRAEGQHAVLLALGIRGQHVGVLRVGVAHHAVAPGDELGDIGIGYVEHPREHPDREVGSDVSDEVELALRKGCVQSRGRQTAQEGLVSRERTRRELTLHELAQGAVTLTIGLQHGLAHA